ncbi:MAG: UDP-N-acetylmuramoyl-L-alanyl-D-glutamate--2,6-diaminopimelate ligase [Ignavibacteriae bacterium]|nr:UDP-N-acetylmuramoyl-L-alanyl-D-glutamate--2,6-diaminopimelate ligase [Ignavibacteriota bacterium]
MLLSELINNITTIQVIGTQNDCEIQNITIDSREAMSGKLFVAIKGLKTDGHKYVSQAISNGVSAVVVDNDSSISDQLFVKNIISKILVKNSRIALAELSNIFYNEPSHKINLIGITGTKGKTTTSYYLKNIFESSDQKTGLIGTNKNLIGDLEIPTKLTTPESHKINSLLSEMVSSNCSHCVMEVSSHSLELNRVDNLDFNVGVFTNITSDHLDFHQNFENYLNAKKIFFDMLKPEAKIIYNKDEKNHVELLKDSKAEKISYSMNVSADIKIDNVNYSLDGTQFELNYKGESYQASTKLIGEFNAYNATAAFGAAIISGVSITQAIDGIYSTPQVPGRFEVLKNNDKTVIIDYSHTADSLEQALKAIRNIVQLNQEVHTVFGCGGDRDKSKRPIMGNIAEKYSDQVYITSDNPRSEDPYEIIKDIENGFSDRNYKVIEDRDHAIKNAIEKSEDDAVVLIAGKGHETYQEINGERSFFSDKETAEKYL